MKMMRRKKKRQFWCIKSFKVIADLVLTIKLSLTLLNNTIPRPSDQQITDDEEFSGPAGTCAERVLEQNTYNIQ